MHIRWGSLRTKIIAWSFVPTAIILTAVALTAFYAYRNVAQDLVIERNRELVRLSASQLSGEMADFADPLDTLGRTLSAAPLDAPAAPAALVAARNRLIIFDAGVVILNERGIVTAADPPRPDILNEDWSSRPYFRQMVRAPGPAYSGILNDGPGGAPVIAIAVPITNARGEFLGAAAGMFRLGATTISAFYGSIVKMRIGPDATTYLVDDAGRVIYHPDAAQIGRDFSAQSIVQQVMAGKGDAAQTRDAAGRQIVASFAPLPGESWGLVSEVSWESLLASSRGYQIFLLFLLGLGVIIPAGVVAFSARAITRPISDLIVAAKEVASGKFGQTLQARSGDEVAELVQQFNLMSSELSASYEAMRVSQERYELVIRATNDGIWDWDLRTNEVYFSPRWHRMLGFGEDEGPHTRDEWTQLVHPDDLPRVNDVLWDYLNGGKGAYQIEMRLRRKDGSYRWVFSRGMAFRDAQGNPYRMTGSHADITDRRQAEDALRASEAEMRALIAAMPDVVLVVDGDGRYVSRTTANPTLLYQPNDNVIGKRLDEIFPQPQAGLFLHAVSEALATNRPVNLEYSLPMPSGEMWFSATIAPMLENMVVWVARDITQRKAAERALEERLAFENLVATVSTEFINLGPDEIDVGIQRALEAVGRLLDVDRARVFLVSGDRMTMSCTHEWFAPAASSSASPLRVARLEDWPWLIGQTAGSQVLFLNGADSLPPEAHRERQYLAAAGICSIAIVPLTYRGTLVGFIFLSSLRCRQEWPAQSIAPLRIIAETFVNALEHKRSQAIQAGQRQFLELLATGGAFSETLHALVALLEGQWPGMLGLVSLLDDDGSHLRIEAYESLPEDYAHSMQGMEIGPLMGSCGTACFCKKRVVVEDIATDPRWAGLRHLALKHDLRACWAEPVFSHDGDVVGAFAMYYRNPRATSEAELRAIETAAHLVGIAIEHKRTQEALQQAYQTLERRVEERTHELATLNTISSLVNRSLDLKEIMRDALGTTMQIIGAEFGGAFHWVEGSEETGRPTARPLAAIGISEEFARLVGEYASKGQRGATSGAASAPFVWDAHDVSADPALQKLLLAEGILQVVSVPLTVKGEAIGRLQLGSRQRRAYSAEQLSLLASIGQQVGVAVENARLYEQAEQSAALVERTRLARELHDSVTQSLYSVTLYAEAAARILAAGNVQTAIEHLRELGDTAREALREMRLLIFELRPPALEKSGLATALQARLEAVEVRGGMLTDLQVEGAQMGERLPVLVQNELYQIAREALNNALKHARAQRVQVRLRFADTWTILEIADDGVGFEPAKSREGGGLGMESMEERAARIGATLKIRSAPGQGATITIEVPLGGAS